MSIFRRREREPQVAPEPEPIPGKWQRIDWNGFPGWGRSEDMENWEVSIALPEDTDPEFVVTGLTQDPQDYANHRYTVHYKVRDKLMWRFLEVPVTSDYRHIVNFNVHLGSDFEQSLPVGEADFRTRPVRL